MRTTSGRCSRGERHRLGTVGGLADDLDVGLAREQHREPAAHEGLVVGDDARGSRRRRSPKRQVGARTRKPPPPPRAGTKGRRRTASTRSRMPDEAVARPSGVGRGGPRPSSRRPRRRARPAGSGPTLTRAPGRRASSRWSAPPARSGRRRARRPGVHAGRRQPSISSSTGTPAAARRRPARQVGQARCRARGCARRRRRAARRADGASRPASPGEVAEMASSAARASLGSVVRTWAPTPAWTAMTDIEWATTSWSSWAMRSRSSASAGAARLPFEVGSLLGGVRPRLDRRPRARSAMADDPRTAVKIADDADDSTASRPGASVEREHHQRAIDRPRGRPGLRRGPCRGGDR